MAERIEKIETNVDEIYRCLDGNESSHSRIEVKIDDLSKKIDQNYENTQNIFVAIDATIRKEVSTKADKTELEKKADKEAVTVLRDSVKELRDWVVGGILISILLMLGSIILRK